jgi:pimeloyl-ACP methyl ester carboxylesterase
MLRARLAAEPLAWGDNGVVYSQELDLVLVSAMYGKESFQTAAKDLRTLRDMTERRGSSHETATNSFERDATARRIARARQQLSTAGLMPLAPDATKATFLSIACGDTPWTGDRASLLAESQQAGEHYPLLGWYELYDPCVFWHRPPLPVRVPDGTGVPPVLMIHSERDPAAPIEGARAARDAFAGARLLTVTDEGDHGTYAIRGNVCVDNVVESYLVDGVIPALGATCPGQPMPAPALLPDTREFIDLLPLGRAAERTIRLGRLAGLLPS